MPKLIDFTCANASVLHGFQGLVPFLLTCLFFLLLGRFAGGARRLRSLDPFAGWGLATGSIVLIGTRFSNWALPFLIVASGFCALSFFLSKRRKRDMDHLTSLLLALGLQTPFLLAINLAGLTGWDDYSHWSPNALLLAVRGTLPTSADTALTVWPSYPPAMAVISFVTSFGRDLVLQAGAMGSWVFLAFFAAALANEKKLLPKSFAHNFAPALLLTTLANPGFNASFSIMGGSDATTMAALGALGLALTQTAQALSDRKRLPALCLQLEALTLALTLLRQMNIVLAALAFGGFVIASMREGNWRKAATLSFLALLPSALLFLVWKDYASTVIGHMGFTPRPLAEWYWHLLPNLLAAMGKEILRKWGLFILILGIAIPALRKMIQRTAQNRVPFVIAAVTSGGYLGFLLCAYLGSNFTPTELDRAPSFYRYASHVALLNIIPLWFAAADWLRNRDKPLLFSARKMALGIAALFAFVLAFKQNWIVISPRPALCQDRQTAKRIAEALPAGASLCFVDPAANGMSHYITASLLLQHALTHATPPSRITLNIDETTPKESFPQIMASPPCDYVYEKGNEQKEGPILTRP